MSLHQMEVKAEMNGGEEESGYHQDEASVRICRVRNPMYHVMGLSHVGCGLLKEHLQCKPMAGAHSAAPGARLCSKQICFFSSLMLPAYPPPFQCPVFMFPHNNDVMWLAE